jgi:transglutaminase-like putative cysteine protease
MKFNVGCQLSYSVTSDSIFLFNIFPVKHNQQTILEESLIVTPDLPYENYVIPQVNSQYIRLQCPQGKLEISYQATVESFPMLVDPELLYEVPPAKLPIETLPYLNPSRYCQSDRLTRLTQKQFGDLTPGYSRVTAICNWIYDNVAYLSGSTDSQTSAFDTVTERAGVCRDFAHLGIAFCRALNIPARFVSNYAYALCPPDFHAIFEAYLGDRWYLFDATRLAPLEGTIRIGTGRDAADAAFATIWGAALLETMNVSCECLDPQVPNHTVKAIASTAA